MDIREEAKTFAIMAHANRYTRYDNKVLEVIHPIMVSRILREAGFSIQLQVAGLLHDVIEDTTYTFYDILKRFGYEVACLVAAASEPIMERYRKETDEEFWMRRKTYAINNIKTKSLDCKYLVCADKIHNISRLIYEFREKGKEDWSLYKAGRDNQLWFFSSIYESLIYGEDPENPFFEKLRLSIEELKSFCGVENKGYCKVLEL